MLAAARFRATTRVADLGCLLANQTGAVLVLEMAFQGRRERTSVRRKLGTWLAGKGRVHCQGIALGHVAAEEGT